MNDNVRENFIRAYDTCADDIFAYCYEKTAHRDIAKHLTGTVFKEAWDHVRSSNDDIGSMQSLIKRIAREQVKGFVANRRSQSIFSDNLWNLTLSQ